MTPPLKLNPTVFVLTSKINHLGMGLSGLDQPVLVLSHPTFRHQGKEPPLLTSHLTLLKSLVSLMQGWKVEGHHGPQEEEAHQSFQGNLSPSPLRIAVTTNPFQSVHSPTESEYGAFGLSPD